MIREILDEKYRVAAKYYLNSSLLSCVREFSRIFRDDVETTKFAFLAAIYDYQMKVNHLINRFKHLIEFMDSHRLMLEDLTGKSLEILRDSMLKRFGSFHRFDGDMKAFGELIEALNKVDLEEVARSIYDPEKSEPAKDVIDEILTHVIKHVGGRAKRMLPNPKGRSARKRLTLFLRWVVRDEFPDLGLWTFISPSHLYISLDSGVAMVFERLTGIPVKTNWKGVMTVTEYFRRINGSDPAKYDYLLSRPAILDICKRDVNSSDCDACMLLEVCPIGRERVGRIEVKDYCEDVKRHDYIRDLFKNKNPWNGSCVRERYVNGRADIVCYIPDMTRPSRIVVVEVKVILKFDGVRQLLEYLRSAKRMFKGLSVKGAIACEDVFGAHMSKILEVSEYFGIEIYKLKNTDFIKII